MVTGSTSGIGLGIAGALASVGADVVVTGLGDSHQVGAAVAEVDAAGPGAAEFIGADVRRPEEIERLVASALSRFGTIDILVNNAGVQHVAPIHEFPVAKWDDIIAINLSAAFHTIRTAVPGMVQQGWGRIINIASAHSLVASPFKSAYVSAKHGLAGLTKTVALEVAHQGITVNAIAPGYVETPLVTAQVADTAVARGITEAEVVSDVMLAAQPTKRFVTIEQVADLALFLCSEQAASITGAVLSIDGGWTAQ